MLCSLPSTLVSYQNTSIPCKVTKLYLKRLEDPKPSIIPDIYPMILPYPAQDTDGTKHLPVWIIKSAPQKEYLHLSLAESSTGLTSSFALS